MAAMAAPLPAANYDAWRAWADQLTGARKEEFAAFNARHGLTRHNAWLQQNPDGSYLVIVLTEGPGADDFMASAAQSDDPFDQWFMSTVAEVHGMDMAAGPPPAAQAVI